MAIFDNFYSTDRVKHFLRGWLLVLGLKEGLVECGTVCVKIKVILSSTNTNLGPSSVLYRMVGLIVRFVVDRGLIIYMQHIFNKNTHDIQSPRMLGRQDHHITGHHTTATHKEF